MGKQQAGDDLTDKNYHFRHNNHNNHNSHNNQCGKNSRNAICFLHNLQNIRGKILFHQCSEYDPVHVLFVLEGTPGKKHASHIHEYADITEGCKSLGAHFNP